LQMRFNLDQKSSQTPCLQGFAYLKLVLLSLFFLRSFHA